MRKLLRPLCWLIGHVWANSGGGPSQNCPECQGTWRDKHDTCGRCWTDRWRKVYPSHSLVCSRNKVITRLALAARKLATPEAE